MPAPEIDEVEETRMTLGEHIAELRTRLFRGVIALVVAFGIGYAFQDAIAEVFMRPLRQATAWLNEAAVEEAEAELAAHPERDRTDFFKSADPAEHELKHPASAEPIFTSATEGFFFMLKVVLFFSAVVGSPVLLWELWQFIGAGLYQHEKKALLRYFPAGAVLLVFAVLFGFFVVLPYAQYFLASTVPLEIAQYTPRIGDYLSLAFMLTLALGAIFQLPILMHALVRLDLVTRVALIKHRPHFIVAAFVLGAILTPPDPFTQAMLAVPMCLLYEIGLFWTRFLPVPVPLDDTGSS